ncbi:MAG: aminoacyl-tRNA hydrolase [Ruminococcaceae bacterium]|nr:aminoacyl-tRNA hydrolase [Oscillospiraceae bacterium]
MADIFDLFKKIATEKKTDSGNIEYLVIGLGNPGEKYTYTRHNAGFLAMDYICQKIGCKVNKVKFKALVGDCTIGGHRALLMKPQTYMNNSGEAVREAADFYKIPAEKIIVISDDVAQAPGRMRIRKSGSAGGQKGLNSIIVHLGTDQFPRIRIGVGEKPNPEYDMADWVLGKIPEEDQKKLFSIFGCVSDSLPLLLDGKIDDAMGKFNGVKF